MLSESRPEVTLALCLSLVQFISLFIDCCVLWWGTNIGKVHIFPVPVTSSGAQRHSVIPQCPVRIHSRPPEIWKSMAVSPFYKCNCLCIEPTHFLPCFCITSRGRSDCISLQYKCHGNHHYSVPIRELEWKSLYCSVEIQFPSNLWMQRTDVWIKAEATWSENNHCGFEGRRAL